MNLLSDDEIEQHFENNSESVPGRELRRRIGRAIEADVLSKLQARQPLTNEKLYEVFDRKGKQDAKLFRSR